MHCVPHHPFILEEAESIKICIGYDCSAKSNEQLFSQNYCLETGPALQPLLFLKKLCITGNILPGTRS